MIAGTPDERDDAVVAVVAIDPFEAGPLKIDLMQRGFVRMKMIQVTDELFSAFV